MWSRVFRQLRSAGQNGASLLRRVAATVCGASRLAEARKLLWQRVAEPREMNLKTLLASAPLDRVDLERERDFGRNVDL